MKSIYPSLTNIIRGIIVICVEYLLWSLFRGKIHYKAGFSYKSVR